MKTIPLRTYAFLKLLLSAGLLLSACSSRVGPDSRGQFATNGQREVLPTSTTARLSDSWKNDAKLVFGEKWVGSRDPLWALDFIAKAELQLVPPCSELKAVELRRLELKPFTVSQVHLKGQKTFSPKEYNEVWLIDACGKLHEWRIVDDPSDPQNPLRVLLWKREA